MEEISWAAASPANECENIAPVSGQKYLFMGGKGVAFYFYVGAIAVVFMGALGWVWMRRKRMEILPRSPYMIMISLLYMMFDTLGNTVLFSIDPNNNSFGVCYIGVLLTVIC